MSFDRSIPTDPEKAKQWISRIYWTVVVSTLLLPLLLLELARLWLRLPVISSISSLGCTILGYSASSFAAHICRRMGISRKSEHRETIRRDPGAVAATSPGEFPVLSVGRPDKRGDPCARINGEGMERRRWRGGPLFVAWHDVEWCTCDTSRDVAGYQNPAWLKLWDRDKKVLLQLRVNDKQAASVLPAIRFYLCGEDLDPAPNSSEP